MAAYMRGVRCLIDCERWLFSARGPGIVVESRRYVRGLRRKPVRVIDPQSDLDKAPKKTRSEVGGQSVWSGADIKPPSVTKRVAESDFVTPKSNVKDLMKDPTGGLRYEKAFPGDKRLG